MILCSCISLLEVFNPLVTAEKSMRRWPDIGSLCLCGLVGITQHELSCATRALLLYFVESVVAATSSHVFWQSILFFSTVHAGVKYFTWVLRRVEFLYCLYYQELSVRSLAMA